MSNKTKHTNWGSYPLVQGDLIDFQDASMFPANAYIPRGNGRSYGDASLGSTMFSMLTHAGEVSLNKEEATVTCKAGTLLAEVLKVIFPEGFFLPLVPGTKYITIGGAIGCDIHGKNHEAPSPTRERPHDAGNRHRPSQKFRC